MGIAATPISARLVAREAGVSAGLAALGEVLRAFGGASRAEALGRDGAPFRAGETLATLRGPAGEVLAAERTLLNLLSRLCGVATLTARYVAGAANPRVRVLDTRKTTPGLRRLEKYAVRCGGGFCHRMGLYDGALIKDNHLADVGGALTERLADAARRARAMGDLRFVEVEVDSLGQLDAALSVEAGLIDIVLLDNMPVARLREAARRRDTARPGILLEASGGVTLETIRAIAASGVDRVSVGALTHQARSVDLGLDVEAAQPGRSEAPLNR
jgi:nicotinate-nucleotide pyrophosphorylase (carboxylating)